MVKLIQQDEYEALARVFTDDLNREGVDICCYVAVKSTGYAVLKITVCDFDTPKISMHFSVTNNPKYTSYILDLIRKERLRQEEEIDKIVIEKEMQELARVLIAENKDLKAAAPNTIDRLT